MGALRKAQFAYDNAEPPPDYGRVEARRIWIDNGVAELLARRDYLFSLRGKQIGVCFERFAHAVDEYTMSELGRKGISDSVLGRLVLAALLKVPCDAAAAAEEIMACAKPEDVLAQLARDLLEPFAAAGVEAEVAEANEP